MEDAENELSHSRDIAGLDHKFWTFVHVNMTSKQSHYSSVNESRSLFSFRSFEQII